jgi:UDP-N-acetylmuramyl pentapeptide phosphotransferase/UDP-N-acetylglucosamine-1-phosphate transferase
VSTADFINTIVIVVGGIAAIYFAQQQNRIFQEQNRIFAAQAGIKMPDLPSRTSLGLYWPALFVFVVALGVGVVVARFELSAPKPFGAIMAAAPWTLAVVLVFSTVYLWKRSKGSELDLKALSAALEQLRSPPSPAAISDRWSRHGNRD